MKKLVIPAAAVALAAANACAQSTVEISGIIDGALVVVNRGNGAEKLQQSGTLSGSRLRFIGTEDLGGGLKAHFVLEQGLFIDTGMANSPSMYRRSIVSLAGPLGRVDLGRDYNPLFSVLVRMDPMGAGTLSSATGFQASAGAQANNAVFYTTPTLAGMTAKVMYSVAELGTGPSRNGHRQGANAYYDIGRATLFAAYGRQETAVGANATKTTKDQQALVGGKYSFGRASVVAMHEVGRNNSGSSAYISNNGVAYAAKYTTSLIGTTLPVAPTADLAVTYQHYNDATATATDRDASNLGVALFYFFSKRTTLYGTVSYLKNTNGGRFTFVDSGRNSYNYTPAAGATVNPKGGAVGLRHVF